MSNINTSALWGLVLSLAAIPCHAKDQYEVTTTQVAYTTDKVMSVNDKPMFEVRAKDWGSIAIDDRSLAFSKAVPLAIGPRPDPVMRPFKFGEDPFELKEKEAEPVDIKISHAVLAANVAGAVLVPEAEVPLVLASALAESHEPLEHIVTEQAEKNEKDSLQARIYLQERNGRIVPGMAEPRSTGGTADMFHFVLMHVEQLDSKPYLSAFWVKSFVQIGVGKLFELRGIWAGHEAGSFMEHLAEKTGEKTSETLVGTAAGDWTLKPSEAGESSGSSGSGCAAIYAPPGQFSPPSLCPNTYVSLAGLPPSAPAVTLPPVIQAAALAFPPPIAAIPAVRELAPVMLNHATNIEVRTNEPGRIVLTPRETGEARQSGDNEHNQSWSGLPKSVEITGPQTFHISRY